MDTTFNIILLRWYYSVLWTDNPGSVQSETLTRPGKKAWGMEHLLYNHEDLYSDSQPHTKLDTVAYACNPSRSRVSWLVKTEEHLKLAGQTAWLTQQTVTKGARLRQWEGEEWHPGLSSDGLTHAVICVCMHAYTNIHICTPYAHIIHTCTWNYI